MEIKDKRGVDNSVEDHLSQIRVDDEVLIDDFLQTEKVYLADSTFVGQICLTSEDSSIDTNDDMSIDGPNSQSQDVVSIEIAIDITVNVACNMPPTERYSPSYQSIVREIHAMEG